MKKWIVPICLTMTIISICVAGLLGLLGYKIYPANQITEEQMIAVSWAQTHPKEASLLRLATASKLYIATWKNGDITTLSLFVDGVWVDVLKSDQPEPKKP